MQRFSAASMAAAAASIPDPYSMREVRSFDSGTVRHQVCVKRRIEQIIISSERIYIVLFSGV